MVDISMGEFSAISLSIKCYTLYWNKLIFYCGPVIHESLKGRMAYIIYIVNSKLTLKISPELKLCIRENVKYTQA